MKLLASCLAVVGLLLAPRQSALQPSAALARVAVIGASVSAGYGIGATFPDGAVNLADIVNASVTGEHTPPRSFASSLVFMNAPAYAERTMTALAKDPPSALVALDYLFWSVHGQKPDAERDRQLDAALAGLEQFDCPILLGDLPDVTAATTGPSPMITPAMMPAPAMREAANTRIRSWAKQRENVTMVPLAELLKTLNEGREIRLRDNVWKESEASRLLQADRLHATLDGLVAIWIASADAWLSAANAPPITALDLNASRLAAAVRSKITPQPR